MSMANENAYMNANDISDEEEALGYEGAATVLDEVEEFARRNPVAVALGAFTLGLIVGIACAEVYERN